MESNPLFQEVEPTKLELIEPLEPLQTTEEKPKRGRKKGSTINPKATKKDIDLSQAVNTISALIAGLTGYSELALTEEESTGLSQAANRVASYYELPDTGAIGAWVNLGLVIGAITYPRYAQLKALKAEKKAQEKEEINNG